MKLPSKLVLILAAMALSLPGGLAHAQDRRLEGVRNFRTGVGIPIESRQGSCAIERRQVEPQIIGQLRAASLSAVSFDEVLRLINESAELTERANDHFRRSGRPSESFDTDLDRRRLNNETLGAMVTLNTQLSSMLVTSATGEPGCVLAISVTVLGSPSTQTTLRATGRSVAASLELWSRGHRIVFIPAADWQTGLSTHLAETLDHFVAAWREQNTPPAPAGPSAPRTSAPAAGR